jgi:hypothetical protein
MRKLLFLLLLLAAAGCGGGSSPTGNELGGVMPWSGQSPASAFKAAEAHCKKVSKSARITQIVQPTANTDGAVVFTCE